MHFSWKQSLKFCVLSLVSDPWIHNVGNVGLFVKWIGNSSAFPVNTFRLIAAYETKSPIINLQYLLLEVSSAIKRSAGVALRALREYDHMTKHANWGSNRSKQDVTDPTKGLTFSKNFNRQKFNRVLKLHFVVMQTLQNSDRKIWGK